MRAREPDTVGYVERDGVSIGYEVFGSGEPTIMLLPTWSIIRSRFWKLQVPYLSRHFRVITFDGRGTGRSSRPEQDEAYAVDEFADDALAVLDDCGVDSAVVVGLSCGALWGTKLAADHPDRVLGLVCLGPAVPFLPVLPERDVYAFGERYDKPQGWAKYNAHYWLEGDYADFLDFFFGQMFHEPHSTKQIEDCVGWGGEVDPARLVQATRGLAFRGGETFGAMCERVSVPVLVIHGDEDKIRSYESGAAYAKATRAQLVTIEGGGHGPMARQPVLVNRLIKDFATSVAPTSAVPDHAAETRTTWTRSLNRPNRVLYLSSPIGLGHAWRDVAIARELRHRVPGVEIDWLAQHPVSTVLDRAGERIHPASQWLVSESAHVEAEAGEHDLHAFQAIRRMDEILMSNFMLFQELVEDTAYDLVVGDEAWEVDYFLHENPELKRFAFAWMTDFVGWLPMPVGGSAEAALTTDLNAEMIAHRARYRRLRDRSIFVGDPGDVVDERFGPGLPPIRDWTEANFDFAGYVVGPDVGLPDDHQRLRAKLDYRSDERVCVVTVGGSGVGTSLLRRVLDAVPIVRRSAPEISFLVVAGPRIDPRTLPRRRGVRLRGYVPNLGDHLAACDLAVVQGGLTTCMELTAYQRPFLYFPLEHHFEQQIHVAHRLDRYGAGRRMDYAQTDPDALAAAILDEIGRPVSYRPVDRGGAARAAELLAQLL